jgi:hypothetical protein
MYVDPAALRGLSWAGHVLTTAQQPAKDRVKQQISKIYSGQLAQFGH